MSGMGFKNREEEKRVITNVLFALWEYKALGYMNIEQYKQKLQLALCYVPSKEHSDLLFNNREALGEKLKEFVAEVYELNNRSNRRSARITQEYRDINAIKDIVFACAQSLIDNNYDWGKTFASMAGRDKRGAEFGLASEVKAADTSADMDTEETYDSKMEFGGDDWVYGGNDGDNYDKRRKTSHINSDKRR